MKFSIVSTILLAQGIASMPWSSSKVKTTEDITLHIQVSQDQSGNPAHAQHNGLINHANHDICWLVCWNTEPQCPEGWYSSQQGECWTCCRSPSDISKHSKASSGNRAQTKTPKLNGHINPANLDICWAACFIGEPNCPDGWNSEDISKHSKGSSGSGAQAKTPEPNGHINPGTYDICLRVCWPEEPKCADGWYSNQMGTSDNPCWTCCKAPSVSKYL
ncbi:hypothetical protein NW752_009109 [Fusarium irregulare]|uniref:Uncharacterized protein n=1 Tax=Fusarium irregulare TaxID=2494466 RepID=A0A9W8PJS7_9HYPO|nr:hypothetical protein NW766_008636 [Fusarium irregulare]KAJ4009935.1 hypothetical protein NW752_009109 [Fusarium irregulare]